MWVPDQGSFFDISSMCLGFRRELPDPPRGPRFAHPPAGETPLIGASAALVEAGPLRQPMGGSLRK